MYRCVTMWLSNVIDHMTTAVSHPWSFMLTVILITVTNMDTAEYRLYTSCTRTSMQVQAHKQYCIWFPSKILSADFLTPFSPSTHCGMHPAAVQYRCCCSARAMVSPLYFHVPRDRMANKQRLCPGSSTPNSSTRPRPLRQWIINYWRKGAAVWRWFSK